MNSVNLGSGKKTRTASLDMRPVRSEKKSVPRDRAMRWGETTQRKSGRMEGDGEWRGVANALLQQKKIHFRYRSVQAERIKKNRALIDKDNPTKKKSSSIKRGFWVAKKVLRHIATTSWVELFQLILISLFEME